MISSATTTEFPLLANKPIPSVKGASSGVYGAGLGPEEGAS